MTALSAILRDVAFQPEARETRVYSPTGHKPSDSTLSVSWCVSWPGRGRINFDPNRLSRSRDRRFRRMQLDSSALPRGGSLELRTSGATQRHPWLKKGSGPFQSPSLPAHRRLGAFMALAEVPSSTAPIVGSAVWDQGDSRMLQSRPRHAVVGIEEADRARPCSAV